MPRTPAPLEPHWALFFDALPESELHYGHSYFPATAEKLDATSCVFPLHQLGLLSLNGRDAKQFLQGQLTADVEALQPGQSCLAAHCDAKGRMQSSFYLYCQTDQHYLLQMPRQNIGHAQAALGKYAIFSQLEIADLSSGYAAFALPASSPLKTNIDSASETSVFAIPTAAGQCQWRVEWIKIEASPKNSPQKSPQQFLQHFLQQRPSHWPEHIVWQGSAAWQRQLLDAGIGFVTTDTVGEWIPQMLNLDRLGGISFNKGCYTGQEIIARMKYRGQVKRRSYRFSAELDSGTSLTAGESLFSDGEGSAAAGTIVDAVATAIDATAIDGTTINWQGLAVIKTQAASQTLQTEAGIVIALTDPITDSDESAP